MIHASEHQRKPNNQRASTSDQRPPTRIVQATLGDIIAAAFDATDQKFARAAGLLESREMERLIGRRIICC